MSSNAVDAVGAMLKCAGRGPGSCGCDRKGEMSSSTCSSISSLAEELPTTRKTPTGNSTGAPNKKRLDVSKHTAVGAFLASLSPRNLFKGLRRPDHHSMSKAERKCGSVGNRSPNAYKLTNKSKYEEHCVYRHSILHFPDMKAMKAALLIQQWYRRYMARIEIRRRYTWTIFQSIEYQGEQDQVKLYDFFNALLTHIPTNALNCKPIASDATSKSSSTDTTVETRYEDESPSEASSPTSRTESNYKGIHLSFPMQRKDLDNLIESFRRKNQHRLHAKYVAGILKNAALHLKNLPNLNQVSIAISKQVTICGDLHGKLDDLLVIFHKNGLPSAENPYVFNGDFVDRGRKGMEVLLLLLTCLLVFPDGVYLNRGNHEDHVMNTRYGFIREVKLKYKHNADRLLKLIETVYRWLPLGTLVNNKVLIVHGGISDSTDIETIKNIDRQKYVSLLRPPVIDGVVVTTDHDKREWKQVFDILWSDPQRGEGCIPNSLRGAGTYFGPDVTEKFLAKNSLQYLVRSHECKLEGYEIVHDDKVITIFSASNYYETGSNKGAYMKLVGPDLKYHFVQFMAAPKAGSANLTFRQKVSLIETSAIKELMSKINASRSKLLQEFSIMDPNASGLVSVTDWCSALEKVTGLSVPWRMLRTKLASLDSSTGLVLYMTTFQDNLTKRETGATVAETLYKNKSSLEAIFRIIDKDNSGFISVEEFKDACQLIGQHLDHPTGDAVDICKSMDMNKDGLVDLNEFLETFRLVERQHSLEIETDDEDN